MLIDNDLLHFCAEKTCEIELKYSEACGCVGNDRDYPRSADDLDLIMQGLPGKPIYHKLLAVHFSVAKFRSFYVPRDDRYDIYYASGLERDHLRYYKSKELLQIHLWQESLRTHDVVELVQNMVLRASPVSKDLDLGHAATSDTLGEIAAMQFLFPLRDRLAHIREKGAGNAIADLAEKYKIPAFIAQRCMNNAHTLEEFFP